MSLRDEINGLFYDAWLAHAPAVVGFLPEVRWQGKQEREIPSNFWVRVSIENVLEEQSTLTNCAGEVGKKMYTLAGLVFVQIFCPKHELNAFDLGDELAVVARNAFRGKVTPSGCWFRNVRINPLEPEEVFYRFNVIAEYEFSEIG